MGPLLAAVCLFGVIAPSAQAALGYEASGEFGSTDLPYYGIYSTGPRIAVDEVTGDILVAPVAPSSTGVFIYGPNGTLLGQIGSESVSAGGIAIDQSNGDLYLADINAGRVTRYTTDRGNPPTYTADPTYSGPVQGTDYGSGQIGSLLSALSVDPTNGDLLVADGGGRQVDRYAPDGSFVGSFDGQGTAAGAFSSLLDIAVDASGRIYLVQNGVVGLDRIFYSGEIRGSVVSRFSADGAEGSAVSDLPALEQARAVAVDPSTGGILVATGGGGTSGMGPLTIWTLAPSGEFESRLTLSEPAASEVTAGIAISGTSGHMYFATGATFSSTGEARAVHDFEAKEVPGVSIEAPADQTPVSSRLRGSVTPVGKATRYHFEYSSDGGSSWASTPIEETVAVNDRVPVSAEIATEPAKKYLVRLEATDGEAENLSPVVAFESPPAPPAVETREATEVEPGRAYLQGTVDPQGSQATYYFEYGTTTAYGSRAPVPSAVAGRGRTAVPVGVAVTGLQPATVYHYRLVAEGPGGQGLGADRTFETAPAGVPERAFELVSPIDKGNVGVDRSRYVAFAGPSGDSMLFATEKGSYPGAEATPLVPRVSATRTPSGWASVSTDPPLYNETAGGNVFVGTLAISDDATRALVASEAALAPGAVAGKPNLYIRNLPTGSFTLVATGEIGAGGHIFGTGAEFSYIGGTPDLSTVAFMGGPDLLPGVVASENIYKWTEGVGLQLVSVGPDGSPMVTRTEIANPYLKDPGQVSTDGNRVYFDVAESEEALYLREGAKTTLVSVSHRPGDPKVPVKGGFVGASADGRYVMFETTGSPAAPPLTVDAPEGPTQAVYRYDAETGTLTYLASDATVLAAYPALGDLYYTDREIALGSRPVYHLHDGVSTLIATEANSNYIRMTQGSPNGRYFAFLSNSKLTSFENAGVQELYLYEAATGDLSCPSCRTDGGVPLGGATIGQPDDSKASGQRHAPRAVFDDGTVFFDTPEPLVPTDTNGERDVYEYRAGKTRLISRGSQTGESQFADADPSGKNVFFITTQRLVSQDKDVIADMYDARVGGGFPQAESESGNECSGGRCESAVGSPAAPAIGSEAVQGTTVPGHSPGRHRKGKRRECRKAAGTGAKKAAHCGKHKKHKKHKKKSRNAAARGAGR